MPVISILRYFLPAALMLCVIVTSASAFDEPTTAEKAACTPDAMKLCWRQIFDSNVREGVFNCLREHRSELSDGCKAAFKAHGR